MLDYSGHCSQRAFILIAGRQLGALFRVAAPFGQQHRNLRAQLGQLKRTGQKGNDGAGCCTSCAKASDGIQVWVVAGPVDVADNVEA